MIASHDADERRLRVPILGRFSSQQGLPAAFTLVPQGPLEPIRWPRASSLPRNRTSRKKPDPLEGKPSFQKVGLCPSFQAGACQLCSSSLSALRSPGPELLCPGRWAGIPARGTRLQQESLVIRDSHRVRLPPDGATLLRLPPTACWGTKRLHPGVGTRLSVPERGNAAQRAGVLAAAEIGSSSITSCPNLFRERELSLIAAFEPHRSGQAASSRTWIREPVRTRRLGTVMTTPVLQVAVPVDRY